MSRLHARLSLVSPVLCLALVSILCSNVLAETYTISGTVKTAGGAVVSGVSVGLYQGTTPKATAEVNADGIYTFTGVAAGTYSVKPGKTGYTCDPYYRSVTVPPSTDGTNFIIAETPTTYTISGTVKTAGGTVISGVSVALYQGTTSKGTTEVNADGIYTFTNVAPGTYTVKAGKTGYVMDPYYRSVTVPPNASHVDFTISQTSTISGLIRTATGAVIPGVSVSLTQNDQPKGTATVNADGRYYFTNLAPGTYVVRPGKVGYIFSSPSQTVTVPPTNSAVNFTGAPTTSTTYLISGQVRSGTSPVLGVEVHLSRPGGTPIVVRTSSIGRFTAAYLAAGTYLVTASKVGFLITPASRWVTVGPSTTICNFYATPVAGAARRPTIAR